MAYPKIQAIMDDYGLELDDIRWFEAVLMAERLAVLQAEPLRLIRHIWSGDLAAELHHPEERILEDLEARLDGGQSDEGRVREYCLEVRAAKRRRRQA